MEIIIIRNHSHLRTLLTIVIGIGWFIKKRGNILKLQCGNAKHMAKRHSIRPGTILYQNDRYDALSSS